MFSARMVDGEERAFRWDFPAAATLEELVGGEGMARFDFVESLWKLAFLLYAMNATERAELGRPQSVFEFARLIPVTAEEIRRLKEQAAEELDHGAST